MRRGKDASLKALISAMAEAESKSYYEEQENALNDLSGLLKTFLNRDDSPERVRIRKDYEAGAALTGKGGIRQRLGAVDMEFFGRAYFPHYFSRPSPEFHRELDAIWQDGVLKGLTPSTPKLVKQISRMNGCKRVVAAPRGHAKSTSLTFKGTIHAVVYGYKHYPIIISDSSDQAEGFLDNIRVEFEENEAIREDFGDLTGKVWRSNVLVTSTNIKVEAIGSGKKIRGRKHRNWRPDLLILDDIENDENVRTPEQRAKLDSWFKKAVSKAGDDYTDIVYIGTLLHYDSFRYTISQVNNLVTLEEELANVENYYYIQQFRFGSKLDLRIRYDCEDEEEALMCQLPKLTLQPIVENSIYHGLERKIGTGHLDIKVTVTDSHLIIMISDDGVGIEKGQVKVMNEQLRALRLEEENNGETGKKGGIAVKNVNNRIKLLFGEEYGIYIYSQPDVGTDVEITLPVVRN